MFVKTFVNDIDAWLFVTERFLIICPPVLFTSVRFVGSFLHNVADAASSLSASPDEFAYTVTTWLAVRFNSPVNDSPCLSEVSLFVDQLTFVNTTTESL